MDTLIKAAAAAFVGCAASLVIKKANPEISFSLTVAVAAVILFSAVEAGEKALDFVKETARTAEISGEALSCVLKAIITAVVTRTAADVCREAGGLAAATAVETAGAAVGVCALIPLMRSVLGAVKGLL